MEPEVDLGSIMDRAMRTVCQECKAEAPLRATNCPECGAALVDDEANRISVKDATNTPAVEGSTIERRANYVLLQKTADGIMNKSLSTDEYRGNVKKLQQIARNGLTVCDSGPFKKRLAESSPEAQKAGETLRRAFVQLQEGLEMMERYADSGTSEDLRMGRAIAEVAFVQLHEIEENSASLN